MLTKETTFAERGLDGVKGRVFLFGGWSGYGHPVKLRSPLSFEEAQELRAYYEAFYVGNGDDLQLLQVEKFELSREPFALPDDLAGQGGVDYFVVDEVRGALEPTTLAEAMGRGDYVRILRDAGGARAERITRRFEYSYRYEYDSAGTLVQTTVRNREATKIIK